MHRPRLFPSRGIKVVRPTPAPAQQKSLPVLTIGVEQFFNIVDANTGTPPDNPITARTAYRLYALAFACMRYRATKLVEAPLRVQRKVQGDWETVEDHPLSELLYRASPDMTMAELLEQVSLYEDATGAALLVKNRNARGEVVSLYPFAKDEFTVEPYNGRLYGRFTVNTLQGSRSYGPDNVIYFRMPSPENMAYVASPVEAALTSINLGYAMFMALRSHLRNAIRPGATFETDQELDTETFQRLKVQAESEYAGVWNQGKTMLLEGGITMKPIQTSFKELELGPVNGDIEAAVCQCFQIHPALVGARIGLETNSGFADMLKSATELFYDIAQMPRWTRYQDRLTAGLLDDASEEFVRFDTREVRALQLDMTERTTQAKGGAGFWTIDEQRAWTGKAKLPNGEGDTLSKVGAATEKEKEKAPGAPAQGKIETERTLNLLT